MSPKPGKLFDEFLITTKELVNFAQIIVHKRVFMIRSKGFINGSTIEDL